MRLIDADALKEAINEDKIPDKMAELMCAITPSNKLQIETLNQACDRHISMIDEQLTVDAVVVRCIDCKYFRCPWGHSRGFGECSKDKRLPVVDEDWFCADGKRTND